MNVIYHTYHLIIVFFLICACSLLYIDVTKFQFILMSCHRKSTQNQRNTHYNDHKV